MSKTAHISENVVVQKTRPRSIPCIWRRKKTFSDTVNNGASLTNDTVHTIHLSDSTFEIVIRIKVSFFYLGFRFPVRCSVSGSRDSQEGQAVLGNTGTYQIINLFQQVLSTQKDTIRGRGREKIS